MDSKESYLRAAIVLALFSLHGCAVTDAPSASPAPVVTRVKASEQASERTTWRRAAIAQLKTIAPDDKTPMAEIQRLGNSGILRYYIEKDGLVRFDEKSWIYIKMHSEDEGGEDDEEIGDIVVAIDHTGTLYEIDADTCGGLLIKSPTGKVFTSLSEFLDTVVALRHRWIVIRD